MLGHGLALIERSVPAWVGPTTVPSSVALSGNDAVFAAVEVIHKHYHKSKRLQLSVRVPSPTPDAFLEEAVHGDFCRFGLCTQALPGCHRQANASH